MTVAFNKFNVTTKDLENGVHNWSSHTLKVLLTNVAPIAANAVKADLTEISAGNGYTAGGTATSPTVNNPSGTHGKLTCTDVVFTAAGGQIGPFRYAVLYNDTPSSPADPLIGWWDYGGSITLNDTETFTVDFDDTNGVVDIS